MNRLPRPSLLAVLAMSSTMTTAEPAPTVVREPRPAAPPFRDNEKIRAAEAKRARRAAKWRKEGRG